MRRKVTYVQCTMKRIVDAGVVRTTSYIPKSYAKVGKSLKLRGDDAGEWVDGWVVETTSREVVEHDDLPDYRKGIRSHRQATGDRLPRLKA